MQCEDVNRYFHRMDMPKILARIKARIDELETSEAAVSKASTGSTDTIRNWRRRVKKGETPGASTLTLQPIADTLNVPLDWLLGNGPDDLAEYLSDGDDEVRFMRLYRRLGPKGKTAALRQVSALVDQFAQSESEED